jgi:hypothetical protein
VGPVFQRGSLVVACYRDVEQGLEDAKLGGELHGAGMQVWRW